MKDKYNLKIPQELVDIFQEYMEKHNLGYTYVSEFIRDFIREKALELKKEEQRQKKEKKIKIESGTYSKDELRRLFEEKKD